MDQMELLKGQVDLLTKENALLNKSISMEFERISKAFGQMGNLMDLLYLETSVLIEMLADKKVIVTEEFTAKLEETAKKVEESIKTGAAEREKEASPIIEKI